MATVSIAITNDDDDGFDDGSSWNIHYNDYSGSVRFRLADVPGGVIQGGVRFRSVGIPQGATINSATITLRSWSNLQGLTSLQAFGDDVDDAAEWSDSSRPSNGFTDTTGGTVFSSMPIANVTFELEIAACVQDIVDRGSWNEGSMRFRILPVDNYGQGNIWDHDASHSDEAVLDVDYTAGAGAETLTADSGSYVYSGTANSLLLAAILGADTDSYLYSGTNVDLIQGFVLGADTDLYTYAGTVVDLDFASAGAFTLTADTGSYSYSGTTAELTSGRILTADTDVYTYTGTNADLKAGVSIALDTALYSYNGTAVTLLQTAIIPLDTDVYTYAGSVVTLSVSGQLVIGVTMYPPIENTLMTLSPEQTEMILQPENTTMTI